MEKIIKKITGSAHMLALSLVVLTLLWSCKQDILDITTTSDVNMVSYLEANASHYSELIKVLEKTGNTGYLEAYGSYTLFAPTNEAFAKFLMDKGMTSIEQMDVEELKHLVRFHLIEDTVSTSSFTDGKLPRITMLGQYIITGEELTDGTSRIRINRQADVVKANIRVGNGLIHSIDQVLQPANQTLAQMLESNGEYSIFTAALQETGLINTLNKLYKDAASTERAWYTVLAQKDAVYQSQNINSYADLKAQYSTTGNPADVTDGLYLYMAYRILPDPKYLADLVSSPSHLTLAPQEVVTSRLKGEQVLINEDIFNGVLEEGVPVDRRASDNTATNGVLHSVTENFQIKKREPVSVFFDLTDQPEIRQMPQFRRPGAGTVNIPLQGTFKDIYGETPWAGLTIGYNPGSMTDADGYVNRDYFRFRLSNNVIPLIEFTTPTIVRGKYRVWVHFRTIGNTAPLQVYFNNQILQRTIDMRLYYPGGVERELLAQGIKRVIDDNPGNSYARLAGTVTVETTGRHKIKFMGISSSNGNHQIDMIQFIPEDQDQLYPKIRRDGTLVYE